MSKELGRTIRLRREELGLTQEELARRVGWSSKGSVNKVELGKVGVPKSKISALAKALDMDSAELAETAAIGRPISFDYCVERQMRMLGYEVEYDSEGNVVLHHGNRQTEITDDDVQDLYRTAEMALRVSLAKLEQTRRSTKRPHTVLVDVKDLLPKEGTKRCGE